MTELLAERKRELLASRGVVTSRDFDDAWAAAWEVMVAERAWPHATQERRMWRAAMEATRPESRAAWLGIETPYSRWHRQFVDPAVADDIAPGAGAMAGQLVA